MNPREFKNSDMPALFEERLLFDTVKHELAFRSRQMRTMLLAAMGQRRAVSPVVVFATSRSGSTWLCNLLFGINQCGPLPEHLRPIHFKSALGQLKGRCQLRKLLDEAATLIRSRRYGGSKLIWDYFPQLFPLDESRDLQTALAPLQELNPVFLRLRRRDIAAQAVSRSLASQTGEYHRYRDKRNARRETARKVMSDTAAGPTYNSAQILQHERILKRAESHLDASISDLGILTQEIVYEELAADPYAALQPLVAVLRSELSPDRQARCLQRALSRASILRSDNAEQIEWLARYRAEQ